MVQEKKKFPPTISRGNKQPGEPMAQENEKSMQSKEAAIYRKTESVAIPGKEQEQCVLCGKSTGICRDTPIKQRKYYIEAAGQLCADCYTQIYMPSHNDNIIK